MGYKIDLHTHTIAAGHAYSTLDENMGVAEKKGMEIVAYTEHGPKMMGGPHQYFFNNLKVLPDYIYGVRVLKGIECNIMNSNGSVDCEDKALRNLDIIGAGLHRVDGGFHPGSREENTFAVINTMKTKKVDFIAHIGNPVYDIDFVEVVKAAVKYNVAIEVNNSSFQTSRPGSTANCECVVKLCKEHGAFVCLGSDSHYCEDVGALELSTKLVKKYGISEDKILNTSKEILFQFLNSNGNLIRKGKVK